MKNKTIQASGNATLGAWQELNVGPVIPGQRSNQLSYMYIGQQSSSNHKFMSIYIENIRRLRGDMAFYVRVAKIISDEYKRSERVRYCF
jgi:hypothetical protein